MAGIGDKKATVSVYVNAEQAKKSLEAMEKTLAEGRKVVSMYKKELADLAEKNKTQALSNEQLQRMDQLQDLITKTGTANANLAKSITEAKKGLTDMDSLIGRMDKGNLQNLYKDLRSAKNAFKVIDQQDIAALEKGRRTIAAIQQTIRNVETGFKGLDYVMKNLKTAPLDQLRLAQEQLTKELEKTTRGTAEYKTKLQQLEQVNAQIKSVTKSFEGQESMITKTMKRLASYVAVYMGFNQLLGKMREVISGNIALSDSIADIQKVTKMTTGQVDALADAIDKIDTRSSQEQLYQLGYQAGMLGLKSTEDILGFIRAADQMNWALKELGEDGAVQLMKVANLTHETDIYGVEQALTKVGSAINEITASSASSAAPIVDYVSRLGSVGATAGYTSSQLVAIGSTLDSLGVHAEMGSTAMTKFIMSLQTNKMSIAEKLGMSYKDLEQIEKTKGSVEVMTTVLHRLKEMADQGGDAMAILEPMFKEFGSEGTRMTQTLMTMINNVDTFDKHLDITNEAFEEGISMLNEYNVKNETAAAVFARLGNVIREAFVNSGFVRTLQSIGKYMLDIATHADRHRVILTVLNAALATTFAYLGRIVYLKIADMLHKMYEAYKAMETAYKVNVVARNLLNAAEAQGVALTEAEAVAAAQLAVANGTATVSTNALTVALKALWAAMLANPITSLIAIGGALVSIVWSIVEAVSAETEAEKDHQEALKDTERWLIEERNALAEVHKKLEEARTDGEKRKKLISEINERFKTYLPNLLTEAADYKEIEKALEGVNKQLSIKAAMQMKEKLDQGTSGRYADALADARTQADNEIDEIIKEVEDKMKDGKTTAALRGALHSKVLELAKEGTTSFNEARRKLSWVLEDYVQDGYRRAIKDFSFLQHDIGDLANDAVIPLAKATAEYNRELEQNETYAEAVLEDNMKYAEALQKNAELIEAQKKAAEEKAEQDRKDASLIKDIANQQNKQLSDWYDQLKDLGTFDTNGVNFRDRFEELFGSEKLGSILDSSKRVVRSKAQAIISDTAEVIKKELASRGLTPELSHKSPGKGGSGLKETVKKDMQEAYNYLKAYYNEQEMEFQRMRIEDEEKYTQAWLDEKVRQNKEAYNAAYKQLSEYLLKQSNTLTQNEGLMAYFFGKGMNLDVLRDKIQTEGKLLWDDITKNMTEAERKQLESMVKHISELEKIIKKYDFVQQAEDQFRDALVKNELYNEATYDCIKEMIHAKEKYTAEDIERQYGMRKAEAEALLILLNDYHDAELEAIRKQNERVAKLVKQQFAPKEQGFEDQMKIQEEYVKMAETLKDMGIGTDSGVTEEEIRLQEMKIEKQKEYMDMMRGALEEEWMQRLGVDSVTAEVEAQVNASQQMIDAELAYTEAMEELGERQQELWQQKHEWVSEYGEAVGSSLEDVISHIGDEEFSWREAGKSILTDMAKVTTEMIKQWMQRKVQEALIDKARAVSKKATNAAEVAAESAKNVTISTANAASKMTDMTVDMSTTTGKAATGLSAAISHIMATLGPWGSFLIPVVTGIIGGGLAAAISAITKSKSEVTEATGVSDAQATQFAKKKVAAGVFTYAEGRYPVEAADGNTYNAKYVNRLGTGLYDGPHMAVFGEKGREFVIDGQTTNRMMTFRPDVYQDIMALRDGIIRRNVRTYAEGRYPNMPAAVTATTVPDDSSSGSTAALMALLQETRDAVRELRANGVQAYLVEDFSSEGPTAKIREYGQWMDSHGL